MAATARGYAPFIVGVASIVAALFGLIIVAEMYNRGASVCFATHRCHHVAIGAVVLGMLGVVLVVRHVATPGHDY